MQDFSNNAQRIWWHLVSSGVIWWHMVASGSIWQHLAASGSIVTSGNSWLHILSNLVTAGRI